MIQKHHCIPIESLPLFQNFQNPPPIPCVTYPHHVTSSPHARSVTVLFADVVGLTEFAQTVEPNQTFALLNELFSSFDAILKRCDAVLALLVWDYG